MSLDGPSFIHVKKCCLGVDALLALHSNVLVMHFGRSPTAGHPAVVVVKKERASCVSHSYPTSTVTLAVYICVNNCSPSIHKTLLSDL